MAANITGWSGGGSSWLDGIDWSFDSHSTAHRMMLPNLKAPMTYTGPRPGEVASGCRSTAAVAPYDMDSLRKAVHSASPGEARNIILSASFNPREQAFTKLIQQCGKAKEWEKAIEVFETMKELPGHKINCFTYTALISACSSAGHWQKALEVFSEMVEAAKSDPECKPNEYTYSALIAACGRGGRFDKALEVYRHMVDSGVDADMVTFSAVISACYRSGPGSKMDRSHLGDFLRGLPYRSAVLANMSRLSMEGNWNRALELFIQEQLHLSMQQALRLGSSPASSSPPLPPFSPPRSNPGSPESAGVSSNAMNRDTLAMRRAAEGQRLKTELEQMSRNQWLQLQDRQQLRTDWPPQYQALDLGVRGTFFTGGFADAYAGFAASEVHAAPIGYQV